MHGWDHPIVPCVEIRDLILPEISDPIANWQLERAGIIRSPLLEIREYGTALIMRV